MSSLTPLCHYSLSPMALIFMCAIDLSFYTWFSPLCHHVFPSTMVLSLLPSLSSLSHYSLCVPLIFLSFHFLSPLPSCVPFYNGSLPSTMVLSLLLSLPPLKLSLSPLYHYTLPFAIVLFPLSLFSRLCHYNL